MISKHAHAGGKRHPRAREMQTKFTNKQRAHAKCAFCIYTIKNMCLYPKLVLNPRYRANKKNGGLIPKCEDYRQMYVPIGCGNCIECRTQKARQWQVRLHEELKVEKYAYFTTLTFSNESLEILGKEVEGEERLNSICALAVRRFLERWRKKHKVSLRHWLITELGHQGTERIHMHGILFNDKPITNEKLAEFWKYGRTDTGEYCTERSINYIIKYVTKVDLEHKDYQARIFCSAGLGRTFTDKSFTKSIYKYRPHNTIEYYTLTDGTQVNLPIYYRNKLFTEEERQKMWSDRLDRNEIYVRGIRCEHINTNKGREKYYRILEQQQKENIAFGYGDRSKEWQKKEYNLTLKMLNKAKK